MILSKDISICDDTNAYNIDTSDTALHMKQGRVGKYHNAYNGSNNHGDIENATYMNQQIFPAAANLEDPAFITPNYKGVEFYIPFLTMINLRCLKIIRSIVWMPRQLASS